MKIVHISHQYYPSIGGVQSYMKNISERLVKDYADDVTLITTNSIFGPEREAFKKIEPATETINGVKVIRFAYRRWHIKPFRFLFKILLVLKIKIPEEWYMQLQGPYSKQMNNYLATVEADVFFASSSNYYFMQLPLWRMCRFFYFGSIHLHEDERHDRLLLRQLQSINASTLYIANTRFEKARMERLGVMPQKIFVLGCGVDMQPFLDSKDAETTAFKIRLNIPPKALLLSYVGRIEKTKSVRIVIEAFDKIANQFPNAFLLIAGTRSEYSDELKLVCEQLSPPVSSRIKWLTPFDSSDKAILFNSIDVLVLPSKNESFGIVFLEAWSSKKPVIGASIGAVCDVVNDGVDGLLAVVDDANDFANKMSILLSDEPLRKSMGENGFNKVAENYTWDIIVARLRKCYVDALN